MKNKILIGNIIVLIIYAVLIASLTVADKKSSTSGEAGGVLLLFAIGVQFSINILLAIIMGIRRKPVARQYGLIAFLMLVMGIFFNFAWSFILGVLR